MYGIPPCNKDGLDRRAILWINRRGNIAVAALERETKRSLRFETLGRKSWEGLWFATYSCYREWFEIPSIAFRRQMQSFIEM